MSDVGWFEGLAAEDIVSVSERIREGVADAPREWPTRAVDAGFVPDRETYLAVLNRASRRAAAKGVEAHAEAEDRRLIHAVRAIDDLDRISNELAERVAEWARTTDLDSGARREDVIAMADEEPSTTTGEAVVGLAGLVADARAQREALVANVERGMHGLAPNLTALAGPLLGARLIALAGGLEELAKMPSSTVQVLGAEEALFAHLRGEGPSPKHGIIYTHPDVRGTDQAQRGSAARAVAGKLTIAARIDHYAGDRRPDLERELAERIRRIQGRSA